MPRHAGLTLRRAHSNREKSSAGYWWVEQLPGAAVVQGLDNQSWKVMNPLGDERANHLMRRCNLKGRVFHSRQEALEALSLAIELDRGF